ncbi:MAG: hypothetical protein AB1306_03100 [Nitrospirota bacterium]
MKIKRFEPVVERKTLIFLSGFVWSVVGVMLCRLAAGWLKAIEGDMGPFLVSGVLLAILIHHFGFLKLVYKNTERISSLENKTSVFAFQERKSYIIILIMICLGIILRHSPIPRQWLAVIYLGFGGAMILSSIKYYLFFLKMMFNK